MLDGAQIEWHLNGRVFRQQTFAKGRELAKKILFPNGAIFTNYRKRDQRLYGQDGGRLCQEPELKEGEKR